MPTGNEEKYLIPGNPITDVSAEWHDGGIGDDTGIWSLRVWRDRPDHTGSDEDPEVGGEFLTLKPALTAMRDALIAVIERLP